MIEMRALKYVISAAIPLLVISSTLDLLLWFTKRFHVPSWAISVLGFCCAALCAVLYVQLYGTGERGESGE